jgi:uncharacterized protein YbjT (DUF2867 family)
MYITGSRSRSVEVQFTIRLFSDLPAIMTGMILVTGGTGFIGQALLRHLYEAGHDVRVLVRPSLSSPSLPVGVPIQVAVTSIADPRGLRASMVGIKTVFHLISGEWQGPHASLMDIDISGTQNILQASVDAGVERFFYISHLGADRASAYPVLKAKGIAEEYIRQSGLDFTILRTAMVFGSKDGFTTGLARLLHSPLNLFFIPGEGRTVLQPLWVEDLVTCLIWSLEDDSTRRLTVEIGGPDYLTFRQVVETVMNELGIRRKLVSLAPGYLRRWTLILEAFFPGLPVSQYWLDYLAVNRTTALDTLPRRFNLLPSRFSQRLAYLQGVNWKADFWRSLLRRNGNERSSNKPRPQNIHERNI